MPSASSDRTTGGVGHRRRLLDCRCRLVQPVWAAIARAVKAAAGAPQDTRDTRTMTDGERSGTAPDVRSGTDRRPASPRRRRPRRRGAPPEPDAAAGDPRPTVDVATLPGVGGDDVPLRSALDAGRTALAPHRRRHVGARPRDLRDDRDPRDQDRPRLRLELPLPRAGRRPARLHDRARLATARELRRPRHHEPPARDAVDARALGGRPRAVAAPRSTGGSSSACSRSPASACWRRFRCRPRCSPTRSRCARGPNVFAAYMAMGADRLRARAAARRARRRRLRRRRASGGRRSSWPPRSPPILAFVAGRLPDVRRGRAEVEEIFHDDGDIRDEHLSTVHALTRFRQIATLRYMTIGRPRDGLRVHRLGSLVQPVAAGPLPARRHRPRAAPRGDGAARARRSRRSSGG